MHSPRPVRAVVRGNDPVFFGVGWYDKSPRARSSVCVRESTMRVSLGNGRGVVLPTGPTRICALRAKPAQPHVFVSSMLPGGQFPDVALTPVS